MQTRTGELAAATPRTRYDRILLAALALMVFLFLLRARRWFLFAGADLVEYTQWYEHIVTHGRLHSLEGSFANYNPPYLYVLSVASLLKGYVSDLAAVKLANVPFLLLSAITTWWICRRKLGCDAVRSATAAVLLLFLPEVLQNAYKWGQTDILHTSLLLLFAALAMAGHRIAAGAVLGVALAFKLQVVFAGPALLAFALAGEFPLAAFAAVPVAYVLMLVPAHLAGRPWRAMGGVYGQQYELFTRLSMGAPNPYVLLDPLRRAAGLITDAGLVVALAAGIWMVWLYRRSPRLRTAEGFLLMMGSSLVFMPYLLPKMHDRYFFTGNCFLFVAAMARPRLGLAIVPLQIAAVLSYKPFLEGHIAGGREMLVPLAIETLGLWLVLQTLRQEADGTATLEGDAEQPTATVERAPVAPSV